MVHIHVGLKYLVYKPLEYFRLIIQPKQKNIILKDYIVYLKCSSMLLNLGYPNLMVALGEVNLVKYDSSS